MLYMVSKMSITLLFLSSCFLVSEPEILKFVKKDEVFSSHHCQCSTVTSNFITHIVLSPKVFVQVGKVGIRLIYLLIIL